MRHHYFSVLGEHQYLPGGEAQAEKRDQIARYIDPRAGYTFYYDSTVRRYCGRGYLPDHGEPFNSKLAAQIQAAWQAAGV